MSTIDAAATMVATRFGAARLRTVADCIARGDSDNAIAAAVAVSGFAEAARELLDACRQHATPTVEIAAYLRGVATGYAYRADEVQVESVWSGPSTHRVPLRATAQVLTELVTEANSELLLVTYSARPYQPLSALAGAEPAAAFESVPGIERWHWPVAQPRVPQFVGMRRRAGLCLCW